VGVISKIEPSHFNGGTAYVAVDRILMDSREPYIFKTTDYGRRWKRVNGDLPKTTAVLRQGGGREPEQGRDDLRGHRPCFFYSSDDGGHGPSWRPPAARAGELDRGAEAVHDVAISTYGRGLYVLDDHHAARAGDAGIDRRGGASVHAGAAYRWSQRSRALINYSVKGEPRGAALLQVLDADGKVVANYDRRRMPA